MKSFSGSNSLLFSYFTKRQGLLPFLLHLGITLSGVSQVDALKLKQEERHKLAHQMVELRDKAKEGWNDEQRSQFDTLNDEVSKLDAEIEVLKADAKRSAEAERVARAADAEKRNLENLPKDRDGEPITYETRCNALAAWALGAKALPHHVRDAQRVGLNVNNNDFIFSLFRSQPKNERDIKALQDEYRAQSVGTTTAGGFSVPDEMMAAYDRALLQYNPLRGAVTVIRTTSGADLPIPTVNDTANSGAILSENVQDGEQDVTFGQVVLQAFMYTSKIVRVSEQLLQDSAINVPTMLGMLLGERIGRIQATHFATGDASSKPNGLTTAAAASGVTLASATAITRAELLSIEHSVDAAYRQSPSCGWVFSDTILKQIRTIGDNVNNPIWMPGMSVGEPDTINAFPYFVSNAMPTGSAAKSIVFGDLSKYVIRDATEVNVKRLVERYADFLQVGFLATQRSDGDMINTAAIKSCTTT